MVLFYTHILLAGAVFLLIKDLLMGGNWLIFLLMMLGGSILPDIDVSSSKINQWSGFLGKVIAFFTTHRGIFHSPLLFIIFFIILSYFWSTYYAWGLIAGYLTHMFGDGITRMGVQPFYPFKFKVRGPVTVGGLNEGIIAILLIILIIGLLM